MNDTISNEFTKHTLPGAVRHSEILSDAELLKRLLRIAGNPNHPSQMSAQHRLSFWVFESQLGLQHTGTLTVEDQEVTILIKPNDLKHETRVGLRTITDLIRKVTGQKVTLVMEGRKRGISERITVELAKFSSLTIETTFDGKTTKEEESGNDKQIWVKLREAYDSSHTLKRNTLSVSNQEYSNDLEKYDYVATNDIAPDEFGNEYYDLDVPMAPGDCWVGNYTSMTRYATYDERYEADVIAKGGTPDPSIHYNTRTTPVVEVKQRGFFGRILESVFN